MKLHFLLLIFSGIFAITGRITSENSPISPGINPGLNPLQTNQEQDTTKPPLNGDFFLANVSKEQNFYIFTDAKPVKKYTFLGIVKSNTSGFGSAQYPDVKRRLLKKARKLYPRGNGLIIHCAKGQYDYAEVILFD